MCSTPPHGSKANAAYSLIPFPTSFWGFLLFLFLSPFQSPLPSLFFFVFVGTAELDSSSDAGCNLMSIVREFAEKVTCLYLIADSV